MIGAHKEKGILEKLSTMIWSTTVDFTEHGPLAVSDEEDERVALWNVNGVGTEVLQLHLGALQVLQVVDGGA